jgi:hypothetical protein
VQDTRSRIRLAVWGLAFFLGALLALHLLNWGAWPRHVSSFVRLSGSWLWNLGLLALSASLVTLGLELPSLASAHKDARLACRLLVTGGFTALLLLLFPTDTTPHPSTWVGGVHDVAASLTILQVGSALFLFVDAGRRDASWETLAGTSFRWPGTIMVLGYAWGLGDLTAWWPVAAVFQRALLSAMAGMLIAIALRASETGRAQALAAPSASPPRPGSI